MRRVLCLLALLVALPLGCVEADLGDLPLLCNPGEPHCPKGYSCVRFKQHDYCVKDGVDPNQSLNALIDRGTVIVIDGGTD